MKIEDITIVNLGYEQASEGYKSQAWYKNSSDYRQGWDYYMKNIKEENNDSW